ncbi:hypothetical protein D2N39_11695 [Gemmobacter lutimaris]|jgi:hypothetical protein|uniref:Uncharacterized protein n=1 Tax=Gemmobacter lutimaris TaxID=2306023 RepID=A0A398BSL3_9RHOB|nr:hypothetical protein [Gemmobacter lutimaris]RID91891.1 hypothetical protein D2N39_11695 [Gemmobacter lutimaris]
MAKMIAITTILTRGTDGKEVQIAPGTCFECKPAEARQFDALGAARQPRADELAAAAPAPKVESVAAAPATKVKDT